MDKETETDETSHPSERHKLDQNVYISRNQRIQGIDLTDHVVFVI